MDNMDLTMGVHLFGEISLMLDVQFGPYRAVKI